jgi:phosphatidylserine/phosphatidylglycerophosphate/cardiolipin synthase-like enzyme
LPGQNSHVSLSHGTVDKFAMMPWRAYDGRADDEDAGASSMHAKCVVIDEVITFITSANFTGAAHHTNVELGVLVRDDAFATRVAGQWRSLVAGGLFRMYQ